MLPILGLQIGDKGVRRCRTGVLDRLDYLKEAGPVSGWGAAVVLVYCVLVGLIEVGLKWIKNVPIPLTLNP